MMIEPQNNMNNTPLDTLSSVYDEVETFVSQEVVTQRKALATIPKTLAPIEVVENHIGEKLHNAGMTFLESIHAEIKSSNPKYGVDEELEELEAIRQDKIDLAQTVNV